MATEREIKTFVKSKKEGSIEYCYGPSNLEEFEVWEVWVFDKSQNEYMTRFVVQDGSENLYYFGQFQQFCHFIQRNLIKQKSEFIEKFDKQQETVAHLNEEIKNLKEQTHRNRLVLYVAAVVFLASSVTLLYLVIKGEQPNAVSFGALISLIASGSVMFFGNWRSVTI